jgi:hypothetical protein
MQDESRRYRQAAARCLRLARKTTDQQTHVELVDLAQKWIQFANDEFELRRIVSVAQKLVDPKSATD